MEKIIEVAILAVMLLFFSVISYRKKALDAEGVLIGNVIGIAMYLAGGIVAFVTTVIFFVAAELSTRFARRKGKSHEKRTSGNIFGNSAAAFLALILGSWTAFFGAFSAALADTLSSEIGLLSKKKPRLLTTFEEVEPGTDGGVTLLGFVASIAGALVIAAIHFYINQDAKIFFILLAAGFLGCLMDSLFGATLERKKMLSNTQVNFIGSSTGAIIAYALSILI